MDAIDKYIEEQQKKIEALKTFKSSFTQEEITSLFGVSVNQKQEEVPSNEVLPNPVSEEGLSKSHIIIKIIENNPHGIQKSAMRKPYAHQMGYKEDDERIDSDLTYGLAYLARKKVAHPIAPRKGQGQGGFWYLTKKTT